jgi:8-amino-7-oxononanoate synthase
MSRHARWQARLDDLESAGRRRRLRTLVPTGPVTARLEGREVVVACSNDYLGLAWHPAVRAAAHGGGTGASRLITGDRPVHHALEAELRDWLGQPAVLFTSGWHANTGLLPALLERGMQVASDALNHASIIDGLRLARAQVHVVPHAEPDALPDDLDAIVLEGLYSMDGDVPPLADYPREPWLIVDEAHALGVLGPDGTGAAAAAGLTPDVRIGTFGKAIGAHGAFVCGPDPLRDLLLNTARSLVFTTAPPEPVAAMALAGLRVLRREPERRARLDENVARLRRGLRQLGWNPLGTHHVVPLVVGPAAMDLDRRLLSRGILAAGIRPPTVAPGTERIRLTVSAAHTREHIDQILDALGPRP